MAKRRLKQGDLVTSILRIFADEFERSDAKSIHEITLTIEKVKSLLHEGQRISYRSGHWIHTQLKRYEEELGFRLFRKEKNGSGGNDFSLTLYATSTYQARSRLPTGWWISSIIILRAQ